MTTPKEQLSFLEGISEKLHKYLLVDESYAFSFSNHEMDLIDDVIEKLKLAESPTSETEKKLDISRLPAGFFDNPFALSPKEIAGLPIEVTKQLSDFDEAENEILELIEMAGGTLVLDKIIAGLFHLTGKSYLRPQITAKLYRMTKKGLVRSVEKKKGVYTTKKELS